MDGLARRWATNHTSIPVKGGGRGGGEVPPALAKGQVAPSYAPFLKNLPSPQAPLPWQR